MIVAVDPKPMIPVEELVVAPESMRLAAGQTAAFDVRTYPMGAAPDLAFSVSNSDVLTVENGVISVSWDTAEGASARVTVREKTSGLTGTIDVTIVSAEEAGFGVGDGGDTPEPTPAPTPEPVSGPSPWAVEEVTAAIGAKLVPDDLQSSYQSNITRAEFCRLMVRLVSEALGQDVTEIAVSTGSLDYNTFSDTRDTDILTAYKLGIVNGVGNGKFNPGGSITRQEAATMLSRTAVGLELKSGTAIAFSDADGFASWAKDGIALVSGLNDPSSGKAVMGGTGGNRFSPVASYTREQAILTALRLFHCCG